MYTGRRGVANKLNYLDSKAYLCQASALPLSYGPINRIREQAKCPKLVPKSTPNLSFPRKSWGPKPLASLARRWLGVSTDLVRGGQGVFTQGRRNTDVREDGRM